MESRKVVLRIYLQGNSGETQKIDYGHGERGREGEMNRKSNMETNITICKIDNPWELWCWRRLLRVP